MQMLQRFIYGTSASADFGIQGVGSDAKGQLCMMWKTHML